jgi:hypothetical protein
MVMKYEYREGPDAAERFEKLAIQVFPRAEV